MNKKFIIFNVLGTSLQLLYEISSCVKSKTPVAGNHLERKGNPDLDPSFQQRDLLTALAKMRLCTKPDRENLTVILLANLPDPVYEVLLEYINSIWKGDTPLTLRWKTAPITFIPKAGNPINTDHI